MSENQQMFKFSPQITTGNVISFCTILAMLALQWGMYSTRVANAETRLDKVEQTQKETQKDVQTVKETVIRMEEQQRNMQKLLERMNQRMEK